MSDFSFLHAADLHLDTPFEGLRALRPEWAEALRDASLHAFERLVDRAIEHRVAFVLLAGDIYDGAERGVRAQLAFLRGLERLDAAGISTFVVHGNHDPVGKEGWSAIRTWPARVHVFAPGKVQRVPVLREGVPLAVVHGVSFGRRAETENLALRFSRGPEPCLHIGLLHANAGGQPGHDPYAPCALDDLRAAGLDYWALGHVHTRQILFHGEQWVAYPGNLQGRSFKASEQGPKGASLVHVRGGRVQGIDFLPLAPVRFETITLDLTGMETLQELLRAAVEQALALGGTEDCEGLMLRLRLVGATELHPRLQLDARQKDDDLVQLLLDESEGSRPWLGWERVEVRTTLPVDRERLLEQQDLLGGVLRQIESLRRDPNQQENLLRAINAPLDSGPLKKHVKALGEDDLLTLLEGIEGEALARLWREE